MRMGRKGIAVLFLIITVVAAVWAGSLAFFAVTPLKPGSQDAAVLQVRKGGNPNEIAQQLKASGAIEDTESFLLLGRMTRQWKKIKAGEYKVGGAMTPLQILATLTSGISIAHPVTVREGENIYEIAQELETRGLASKDAFLKLCRKPEFIATLGFGSEPPPTLEGYLFPDTYFFNRSMTPEDMVRQMSRHFLSIWTAADEARARELGLSRHEAVTLASIIEKETGAPQERPLISSVFHNRLKKRMRLQSDPTTIYGMWERYDGNLHKVDLQTHTPYNTYTVPALPVGPISNPGKEALQAALYPTESPFLFFVSHNDGTHEFTRNLEDHMAAVRRYQLDRKAREGKSWRDLQKKGAEGSTTPAAVHP